MGGDGSGFGLVSLDVIISLFLVPRLGRFSNMTVYGKLMAAETGHILCQFESS